MRLAALALVALSLAGCESNQERNAKLATAAEQHEGQAAKRRALAQQALTITRPSVRVKVIATAIVTSSQAAAAIVTLRNISGTPLRNVPLQIDVKDARGRSIYRNNIPGLSATLLSVALLPAHGVVTWIDDQVQAAGTPASVSARVGEGRPVGGTIPELSIEGSHLTEAQGTGAEAEGNLVNRSAVTQQELVIDAVARRAGRIVAAGRAVIAQVLPQTSTPLQIFFVGDPRDAQLVVSAPATAAG